MKSGKTCKADVRRRQRAGAALVAVLALVAAACDGGDSESSTSTRATVAADPIETTAAPESTPVETTEAPAEPVETTEPVDDTKIDTLPEARGAVVRIVAEGTFVDPIEGFQPNTAGSGSGFIISDDGVAVTNNHVVTGAALLRVHVEGEDEPRNARVLGVSECSDLAVIDIDGDGLPSLDWADAPGAAGESIFALGFPLGDSEYTVLDGVISKESVSGETYWASVDSVIEHSADTLPGNSGGPIVDTDAQVVAVNYAGNEVGQAFAIGIDIAVDVVDKLASGEDDTSLGINGQAVLAEDESFSGIWVASVESGSPADLVGIEAGDLMMSLEGLVLATDGTMSDYCDILRSHDDGDALAVEVYRVETDEFLKGTINVEGAELKGSPLGDVVDESAEGGSEGAAGYSDYVSIIDDSGTITVDVPAEWAVDVIGASWNDAGEPALSASPDREAWTNTWTEPGVFIGVSRAALDEYDSAEAYLDSFEVGFLAECAATERIPYDDGLYVGSFDFYEGCGSTGATFMRLAAVPIEVVDQVILMEFQAITEADLEALVVAGDTFISSGEF